jgi:hypothetical protein
MPKILFVKGFEFFFYSNEGNEPRHIHVTKAGGAGKIWLEPAVKINYMYGFSRSERREIMLIIHENLELLKKSWNEHFSQ